MLISTMMTQLQVWDYFYTKQFCKQVINIEELTFQNQSRQIMFVCAPAMKIAPKLHSCVSVIL